MRQLKVFVSVFLFSATICGAVEDGVYSCKPELICRLNLTENSSRREEPSQNQVDKALEKWKITDKTAEELLLNGFYSSRFLRNILRCEVATNLQFQPPEDNTIVPMSEEVPTPKLTLLDEEIKVFWDVKKKNNVGDGDEGDRQTVASSFRVVTREEDIVVAELDRLSGEWLKDFRSHGFMKFFGDRLVLTSTHVRDGGDTFMIVRMSDYRCERL